MTEIPSSDGPDVQQHQSLHTDTATPEPEVIIPALQDAVDFFAFPVYLSNDKDVPPVALLKMTSDGEMCFVISPDPRSIAHGGAWVETSFLCDRNPHMHKKISRASRKIECQEDDQLGVKGWTIFIGAMILSTVITRGCDDGSKLVVPQSRAVVK